jgi:hypothetical protein
LNNCNKNGVCNDGVLLKSNNRCAFASLNSKEKIAQKKVVLKIVISMDFVLMEFASAISSFKDSIVKKAYFFYCLFNLRLVQMNVLIMENV